MTSWPFLRSARSVKAQSPQLTPLQYEVEFSESFIPDREAEVQLQAQNSRHRDTYSSDVSKSLYSRAPTNEDTQEARSNLERLVLHSRPYLCRIPFVSSDVESESNSTADASEAEKQQQELMRASSHGWELLSGMQGHCLYYSAGWWVYSFCYNDVIKQFHPLPPGRPGVPIYPPVEDPGVASFTLGKFKKSHGQSSNPSKRRDELDQLTSDASGEATQQQKSNMPPLASDTDLSTALQTRGETNFLVQKLNEGTTCDLTGRDRRVEVQFHCNPASPDRIQMIRETASCVYLMVVHTPRLCNDVAFMPPQVDRPNKIACQEIVGKEDEREWTERITAKAKMELFGNQKQTQTQPKSQNSPHSTSSENGGPAEGPIVIGGIELGAQKLVGGSPERTIKSSNIVKPPKPVIEQKEKYIATLAKSDGKSTTVMAEREIKRHGIKGTMEDVHTFVDQIEKWAGEGRPWRLDVVQTPEGMQFRGILVEDGEDDGDKGDGRGAHGGRRQHGLKGGDEGGREESGDREEQEGSHEEFRQNLD